MIINRQQLTSYLTIFGMEKMLFLWQEYLCLTAEAWEKIESLPVEKKRAIFHNWRSSSQVFGMEDFANKCAKIEEDILKQRLNNLVVQINECKTCQSKSIDMVKQILEQTEAPNE